MADSDYVQRVGVHRGADVGVGGLDALVWSTTIARPVRDEQVAGALQNNSDDVAWAWRGAIDVAAPDIEAIICAEEFTWPCEWALVVVRCESSGEPLAVNWAGPYFGLWQVLNGSTDPWLNTLQAHVQFREWMDGIREKSPWPTCGPVRP